MGIKSSVFVLLTVALFLMLNATSARDFPLAAVNPKIIDLAARLQLSADGTNTTDCWGSLSELRTCSNEIIGFFLNGYTDIDAPCCQAIEVIINHCWPSMLGVLGFTTEEGNLLAAYCSNNSTAGTVTPAGAPPVTKNTTGSHF
ncbi:egg cell-secreted protein 1.4-like [Chenopodium quinoa]|uniref:Prolamin-like domain-containing protein n=1 Tax=Chenopodium quinoa TaxID=63459 RepID=A0A803LQ05_CHEQI|nr:egg cell-secreted protein 1.4-like [Chenopodium quinoa]